MRESQRAAMLAARKARGRPSARDAMLDAAETVVIEQGAARLTLDAVARAAAVSKGGLMYHFPSKDALLQALVTRAIERSHQARAAQRARLPAGHGQELLAYLQASVGDPLDNDRVSRALLGVVTGNPQLMAPVREFYAARLKQLAREVPFERAALVYLATEGLWLMELLDASPFSKSQRSRVLKQLRSLAVEGGKLP